MKTLAAVAAALLISLGAITAPASADKASHPPALRVVTAGDSISAGAGTVSRRFSWPGRLHRRNLRTIDLTNVARSASCLIAEGCGYGETLASSFRRDVLSLRPDVAIVAIGRNDLCHVSTSDYKATMRNLRVEAEKVGVRVIFGTITPPNERWQWPCEDQAAEINEWLLRMPGTIDFASAIAGRDGLLRKRYDFGDGLHPNGRGQQAMARAAEAALLG